MWREDIWGVGEEGLRRRWRGRGRFLAPTYLRDQFVEINIAHRSSFIVYFGCWGVKRRYFPRIALRFRLHRAEPTALPGEERPHPRGRSPRGSGRHVPGRREEGYFLLPRLRTSYLVGHVEAGEGTREEAGRGSVHHTMLQ